MIEWTGRPRFPYSYSPLPTPYRSNPDGCSSASVRMRVGPSPALNTARRIASRTGNPPRSPASLARGALPGHAVHLGVGPVERRQRIPEPASPSYVTLTPPKSARQRSPASSDTHAAGSSGRCPDSARRPHNNPRHGRRAVLILAGDRFNRKPHGAKVTGSTGCDRSLPARAVAHRTPASAPSPVTIGLRRMLLNSSGSRTSLAESIRTPPQGAPPAKMCGMKERADSPGASAPPRRSPRAAGRAHLRGTSTGTAPPRARPRW